ncbi:3-methyladenine DNA glycosylase [Promicromonospora sp. Populi]|uniref:3-methyladenine DNA glycosylase n=1 Tax=Promicromonospora sp. Populi TaxID=3239420 RepID=UPI0034E22E64
MSTLLGGPTAPGARDAVVHQSETNPAGKIPGDALRPEVWLPVAAAHADRADALTAVWRAARAAGRKHAIEDFLFTYYPTRIAHLRRWHPGAGVALALPDGGSGPVDRDIVDRGTADRGTADADDAGQGTVDWGIADPDAAGQSAVGPETIDPESIDPDDRTNWRWHTATALRTTARMTTTPWTSTPTTGAPRTVALDIDAFLADRGDTVRYVRELLSATASRPGTFGCFGLHEWAMVYRDRESGRDQRHPLPLRLGHAGTDAVVEANPVRCSHFDAFRFFTPEATARNQLQPSRAAQVSMEQPGCLHANMDLYKWCLKLGPAVPGDLLLDAFELARDIRWTDMAASPYDVSEYGVAAVEIETPQGKAEYVQRQRDYARRSGELRRRLLAVCDAVLGDAVLGSGSENYVPSPA